MCRHWCAAARRSVVAWGIANAQPQLAVQPFAQWGLYAMAKAGALPPAAPLLQPPGLMQRQGAICCTGCWPKRARPQGRGSSIMPRVRPDPPPRGTLAA